MIYHNSDVMSDTKNQKQATSLQMVKLDRSQFAVELLRDSVQVNLTHLANRYGTKPLDWLRTDEAKDYLNAIAKVQKCTLADLVIVKKGGTPGMNGTWSTNRQIALRFVQWLDPIFAIKVDCLLEQLLFGKLKVYETEPFNGVQPIVYENKVWFNYLDVLESIGYSRKSGSVTVRKLKYPQHFNKIFGRNFITPDFCVALKNQKAAIQLCFDFDKQYNVLIGGVQC